MKKSEEQVNAVLSEAIEKYHLENIKGMYQNKDCGVTIFSEGYYRVMDTFFDPQERTGIKGFRINQFLDVILGRKHGIDAGGKPRNVNSDLEWFNILLVKYLEKPMCGDYSWVEDYKRWIVIDSFINSRFHYFLDREVRGRANYDKQFEEKALHVYFIYMKRRGRFCSHDFILKSYNSPSKQGEVIKAISRDIIPNPFEQKWTLDDIPLELIPKDRETVITWEMVEKLAPKIAQSIALLS